MALRSAPTKNGRTVRAQRSSGTGRVLTFAQPEGDETVGRVVGRQTDGDAIARDHANSEAAHSPGKLGGHLLVVLERDLIAPSAEDLIDASSRLNQVVSCQIESVLPVQPLELPGFGKRRG